MANQHSFPSSPVIRLPQTGYSPYTEIKPQSDYFTSKDEKHDVIETVQPVETPYSDADRSEQQLEEPQWTPGFFAQFPWLGFGALATALTCAIVSVVTLLLSDGKSQHQWPQKLAPNVIISGLNSAANICFSMAIGEYFLSRMYSMALADDHCRQRHRDRVVAASTQRRNH